MSDPVMDLVIKSLGNYFYLFILQFVLNITFIALFYMVFKKLNKLWYKEGSHT